MKYLVVITKMENNYCAYSPDVDGCVSTGKTAESCLKNIKEALVWHLEGEEQPAAKGIDYWLTHLDEIAAAHAVLVEIELGSKILTTKDAFRVLLSERGIYKKLEVDRSTVANWKRYAHNGHLLSIDKMEEVLRKGGWQPTNQSAWVLA
jgi:predicted RNase H-like HicB family nuclease